MRRLSVLSTGAFCTGLLDTIPRSMAKVKTADRQRSTRREAPGPPVTMIRLRGPIFSSLAVLPAVMAEAMSSMVAIVIVETRSLPISGTTW